MNKKKILSLIMALVMLVGVFSPLTALAAANDGSVVFKITTKVDHDNDAATPDVLAGSLTAAGKTANTTDNETSITFNTDSTKTLDANNVVEPTVKPIAGYRFVKWDKAIKFNSRATTGETVYTAVIVKDTATPTSTAEKTETVTLHKILLAPEVLAEKKFPGQIGLNSEKYNGNQVSKIEDYFGKDAKEADKVYFALKFAKDFQIPKGNTTIVAQDVKDGKAFVKASSTDKLMPAIPLTSTTNVDEAVGGLTTTTGIVFKTSELKGKFEIDEIISKSTYNQNGKVLTGSKAVPVVITLPLVNEQGIVKDAHVYPKNTDNKPSLDKNFTLKEAKKSMSAEEAAKLQAAVEHKIAYDQAMKNFAESTDEYKNAVKAYTEDDKALIKKWGIDFSDPSREGKAKIDRKVGDLVEYTVETEIPAQTKWGTAFWDDKMTDGLTFVTKAKAQAGTKYENKGIVIKYDNVEMDTTWYTLNETENGFTLTLTDAGLKGINGKEADAKITLTYNAEVNKTTITDIPDSNDITFHYGNDKHHGNTPVPNTPDDNGGFKVTKKWATGTELPKGGIDVTFTLYNANTGKKVTVEDLVEPTDENEKAAFNSYKQDFKNPITKHANKTDEITFEWKYLDKKYEYKAEETYNGYAATYTKGAAGAVTVENKKTNNPEPINPSEPKVVTGGKKFVKTDNKTGEELTRLAGAEFLVTRKLDAQGNIIKNTENTAVAKTEYLALKSGNTTAKEVTDYENAEKAYKDFIAAFNKIVADAKAKGTEVSYPVTINGASYNDKNAVDTKLATLKADRDTKFLAARENYKWIEAKDAEAAQKAGALVLTSDDQGRLEINGIAYGDYQLVEIKAPDGFAKLPDEVKFTVSENSYKGDKAKELKYTLTDKDEGEAIAKDGYGQQIVNKKVTIPQTGGIGTVLFTVVGIGLMAGAVMAMKKNREEA